jgi:hypothetical protein
MLTLFHALSATTIPPAFAVRFTCSFLLLALIILGIDVGLGTIALIRVHHRKGARSDPSEGWLTQKIGERAKSLLPNPYSAETTYAELNSKATSLVQGATGVSLALALPGKIIAFVIATAYLHWFWLLPMLATVFMTLGVVLRFRAVRAIRKANTDRSNSSYLRVLIETQYYDVLQGLLTLPVVGMATAIAFGLAGKLLLPGGGSRPGAAPGWIAEFLFPYFPLIVVAALAGEMLRKCGLLRLYRKRFLQEASVSVPQVDQTSRVYQTRFDLYAGFVIISGLLVMAILYFAHISGNAPSTPMTAAMSAPHGRLFITMIGFLLLSLSLAFVQLKRMQRLDLSTPSISPRPPQVQPTTILGVEDCLDQSEKFKGVIYGVLNQRQRGFSFLGAGKMYSTENTLLFTDQRLIAAEVPIAGSDKMLADTSYSYMAFFWNRGEIRKNGEELLRTNTFQGILESKPGNRAWPYEEIQSLAVDTWRRRLTIVDRAGTKTRYLYMDSEYGNLLSKLLPGLLGGKCIFES